MNIEEALFFFLGFALLMKSGKYAKRCKVIPTLTLGALAWCALFLPRIFIWQDRDQSEIDWWVLLIGALGLMGGPLLMLVLSLRKKKQL